MDRNQGGSECAGDRIFDRDPLHPVQLGCFHQRLMQRAVGRGGLVDHVRHDLGQRGARGLTALLSAQLRIDLQFHRLKHRDFHLREKLAADLVGCEPREIAVFEPVDPDRNDRRVRFVRDQRGAVIDLHQ
jgi:hypothetical protein